MDRAWELGITTFDTADAYGGGRSEAFIGRWLETKDSSVRDTIVVETKTFNPNEVGADRGLSGARILRQIDVSLGRLGLERVALYLAHEFDPDVPQEETLRAFDELVRAGKVGAVGASNFDGRRARPRRSRSRAREGLTRYEWVQSSFSLLDRDEADDVLPVLPRARSRLRGVRPARRRLAHRQVPPRQRVSRRIADDAAAGVVREVRVGPGVRRPRGVRARGARARRLDGRACDRLAPRRARPHGRRRRARPAPSISSPVREALALELTSAERAHLRGLFQ